MIRRIAVVFILWSSAALAQSSGARAEALFRQGRDLLAAGRIVEACSAFEESQKVDPAVTTLLNLAGCRERLGQLATAWELFLEAARQTESATDAANQQLHSVAKARLQKLRPRISMLTIKVPLQSQVAGLEIVRGVERIGTGLWNRALSINGGTYTITARAPGASPWSTQVTIAVENDSKTVEIPDLRHLPRRAAGSTALTPSPAETRNNVMPIAVGASALALLSGGLGFELWAQSRYGAAKSEMTSQSRRDSLESSANMRRYLGEAFTVSGFVAGGTAVWLYLRDRNRERDAATSASMSVVPTVAGVTVAGQF
jgi:hypothetical protein